MQSNRNYQISDTIQAVNSEVLKDGEYRIVLIDAVYIYLVEICKRPRKLYRVIESLFYNDFQEDLVRKFIFNLPFYLLLPREEISDQAFEEMEARLSAIKPALIAIDDVIKGNEIGKSAIKESIKNSGIDKTRIYNYIYRYLMFDKIPTALLPARSMQGGKGVGKQVRNREKVRGKPREFSERIETINIEDLEKKRIKRAYNNYYRKLHKGTGETCNDLSSLLRAIWFDYYRETDEKGNKVYAKKKISIDQLRYWLPKLTDGIDFLSRKIGSKNIAKDHKGSHGTFSDITNGPAHIYAIDGNTADCYLGSKYEHHKRHSTGKSLQYNIVDAFSGMLVSTTFDFRSECLARALEALLAAYIKKSDLGKLWGVEIDDDLWPCHHISNTNLADRSSLLSEKKNVIHGRFGVISSDFCPAYRPDQKSLVESTNKMFNEKLFHRLPGAVIKALKRGEKNPAELACIDMQDIYTLAYEVTCEINHRLLDRKYLSKEMARDGVKPQPIEIWKWGLENCNLYGMDSSEYDKKLLFYSLSEQVEPRVNNKGIYLAKTNNQLFYEPSGAKLQKLVRLHNDGGSTKDICRFYTGHRILGSINTLYLISKHDNEIIECRLHSRSQRMENLHITQTLELVKNEKHEDQSLQAEADSFEAKVTEMRRDLAKKRLERMPKGKKNARKRAINISEECKLEQALQDLEKAERISDLLEGEKGKTNNLSEEHKPDSNKDRDDSKKDKPRNKYEDFIVGV